MLLKKSVFFSIILLLISISSAYPSSENPPPPKNKASSLILTENERVRLVKSLLSNFEKLATQDLIKDIVELTNGYTTAQVAEILVDIMGTSEEDILERYVCLEKLKKAINQIDTDQMKQQKLKRLKEIVYKPSKPLPFNFNYSLKGDIDLYDADAVFPTADERLRIVKEVLLEHKKSASKFLMRRIVEQTSGFEMSYFRDLVTDMVKESKSSSLDQEMYLQCPTPDERREVVEKVLLLTEKSAPEDLIKDIVELTEYYDVHTVKKLVRSMAKKSKTDSLDRNSCIAKLRKAIDLLDEDEVKKFKIAQIEAMTARESSPKIDDEQK